MPSDNPFLPPSLPPHLPVYLTALFLDLEDPETPHVSSPLDFCHSVNYSKLCGVRHFGVCRHVDLFGSFFTFSLSSESVSSIPALEVSDQTPETAVAAASLARASFKTPLPAFLASLASFPAALLSHRLPGWSQVTVCNFLPQLHRVCARSGSFPPPGIAGLPSPSGIDRPLCCQPRAAGQGCVRAQAPGRMVLSPQGLGVLRDKGGEWWRERGEGASGPWGQGVRIEETRGQPPPDLTALWFPFLISSARVSYRFG